MLYASCAAMLLMLIAMVIEDAAATSAAAAAADTFARRFAPYVSMMPWRGALAQARLPMPLRFMLLDADYFRAPRAALLRASPGGWSPPALATC